MSIIQRYGLTLVCLYLFWGEGRNRMTALLAQPVPTSAASASEVGRLTSLVKAQLARVEIQKIEPAHLATSESRAVVGYALEQAFRTFVGWETRIGIEGRRLRITVTEPELAPFNPSSGPEAVLQDFNAHSRTRARLRELSTIADQVSAAVFVEPPVAKVTVEELFDPKGALQSLRAADGQDLIAALARAPLDYAAVWRSVMQSVTSYSLSVETELPRASESSRYTLRTKPVSSHDANWTYQKFFEVALWDPMSRDPIRKGHDLRIEANLVVGFRKNKTDFRYFKQSTPESDALVNHILATIKKP